MLTEQGHQAKLNSTQKLRYHILISNSSYLTLEVSILCLHLRTALNIFSISIPIHNPLLHRSIPLNAAL